MAPYTFTVQIDPRAGSKQFLSIPPLDTCSLATNLKGGDVRISMRKRPPNQILIELKTLQDFSASIENGRLVGTQIPAMFSTDPHAVCLFIYGDWYVADDAKGTLCARSSSSHKYRNMQGAIRTQGALRSAIWSLQDAGVTVTTFNSETYLTDVANAIYSLATWAAKPYDRHVTMLALDNSTKPKMTDCDRGRPRWKTRNELNIALLAERLPGISVKKLPDVVAAFSTPHHAMNASIDEWKALPGVGNIIAQRIHNFMHNLKGTKR
jgi:ERCC4-type nuclease